MKTLTMRTLLWAILLAAPLAAQRNQVQWTAAAQPANVAPGSKTLISLTAKIEPGWHLYSLTVPSSPANIPTSIKLAESPALAKQRTLQPAAKRAFDKNFNTETETYEDQAVFLVEAELAADAAPGALELTVNARYQLCSDTTCIPPVRRAIPVALTVEKGAAAASIAIPAGYAEPGQTAASAKPADAAPAAAGGGAPQDLGPFLLVAFGFGLAAIFTPCVFPMIPITMSYFLNRGEGKSKSDGVIQAAVFCFGIIVLFTGMGLALTALLGPFGVVQIGSNPWVNGFIAIVFLVFGLSLLGAFEITIPSALLTKMDQASQKGGYFGSLFMGLTFSLTSFACVGPFVGTLLASSVQGGGLRPALGMIAFASGLALPFFVLAMFPGYLKKMPRSGGWLARVKVVMGFIILAAMFKYLSSVDQVLQWNVLTRERFLAIWIVLFLAPGLYLLGWLGLEGVKKDERLGLGRLLTALAFVAFSVSLLPGMFGGKLGELDAYVPLAAETSGGGSGEGGGLQWAKNDFQGALARAKAEGKRVLVAFTGYACTNCHWMKANLFTRPEVAAAMKDFVLVELYTDGADAASEENQKLQESRFQTIAIPFYAIFDGEGNVVATFAGLTRDPQPYLAFLNKTGAPTAPAQAAEAVTGPPLSDLKATKLEGGALDTASLNGKVVVVNFWATWCVPCIGEIPGFNKVHQAYTSKGVAMIGVSMDEEGAAAVKPFLKEHPIEYPVALADEGAGKPWGVEELPVTLIFGRDGKLVDRFKGFAEEAKLEAAIQKQL